MGLAPVLAGLIGAIITALVTAYLGRRSKTGKIDTSEAKDLWETLKAEMVRGQHEAAALRAEIAASRNEMITLREEQAKLRISVQLVETQLEECHNREKRMSQLLASLNIDASESQS